MTQSDLQNQNLQVFDIDGTLETAGGVIKLADIKSLKHWGILSSRAINGSKQATGQLKPLFIEVCRVDMRAEELKLLKGKYPNYGRYIYIADREVDKSEALRASWEFCFAHTWKFENYV